MSPQQRIVYFSLDFLWAAITFWYYVGAKIAVGTMPRRWRGWNHELEAVASWALKERDYLIDEQNVTSTEEDTLFRMGEKLGDQLLLRWGRILEEVADRLHAKLPLSSRTEWQYFCYCWFLEAVLVTFEQVAGSQAPLTYADRHLLQSSPLSQLSAKLANEQAAHRETIGRDKPEARLVQAELEAFAARMSEEWRQAVVAAAHDGQLPGAGGSPP